MNVEIGERGRAVSFLGIHNSDLLCSVGRASYMDKGINTRMTLWTKNRMGWIRNSGKIAGRTKQKKQGMGRCVQGHIVMWYTRSILVGWGGGGGGGGNGKRGTRLVLRFHFR
jgi:hypothetical protein